MRTYGDAQRPASGGFPVVRPKAAPEVKLDVAIAAATSAASSPRERTNSFG
jgi:hypothetical protein